MNGITATVWTWSTFPTSLPSATKLQRLCFYTCLSFCSQGECTIPACITGGLAAGLQGGCLLWGSLEPPLRKQTATVADGTHPTGMHSCFKLPIEQTFLYNSIQPIDNRCEPNSIHQISLQLVSIEKKSVRKCVILGNKTNWQFYVDLILTLKAYEKFPTKQKLPPVPFELTTTGV